MKTRFTLDFKVFSLMLKELRGIKRELRNLKSSGGGNSGEQPVRNISDKIHSSEVMRRLKISPATLIKYEKLGLLKFHKEGHVKVYSESEVVAFKKMKGRRKRLGKNFFKKKK
ncbi:MAG: MerR family transcriptional regulator [Bacteroidetes bacterium]|nr:MerR family transcriptional regulator [Bacteroidota bacterium]